MNNKEKSVNAAPEITGRCYCGRTKLTARAAPVTACYCHCEDCRRWTGAPAPAFAGFETKDVILSPETAPRSHAPGVQRWVCTECGSPMLATFEYLEGQAYVPIGILDAPNDIAPKMHTFANQQIEWLHLQDDLPRESGTGTEALRNGPKP